MHAPERGPGGKEPRVGSSNREGKLSQAVGETEQVSAGAPPSELLFQILEVLFSPEEAELVALLPIKPFNVKAAAHAWKKTEAEAP